MQILNETAFSWQCMRVRILLAPPLSNGLCANVSYIPFLGLLSCAFLIYFGHKICLLSVRLREQMFVFFLLFNSRPKTHSPKLKKKRDLKITLKGETGSLRQVLLLLSFLQPLHLTLHVTEVFVSVAVIPLANRIQSVSKWQLNCAEKPSLPKERASSPVRAMRRNG